MLALSAYISTLDDAVVEAQRTSSERHGVLGGPEQHQSQQQ
jgi:hypothetical protein